MSDHGAVSPARLHQWFSDDVEGRIAEAVGGPARLKVIFLLACVLGLEAADVATVGAVAPKIEAALHIGNIDLGLLVTVSTAIGAFATLPVGVIVDRFDRTRLLALSILLWCAAELVSAAATSYLWLLLTRLALGAVVATAGPAVNSLTGDFFRVSERGRIYGYILTGELVGAGVGILVSGDLGALSWRLSFAWLAIPGTAVAVAVWRLLPEPVRGGQSRLAFGDEEILSAADVEQAQQDQRVPPRGSSPDDAGSPGETEPEAGLVEAEVEEQGVSARQGLVLQRDPTRRNLWWAVRYVLAVPTNRLLIVASALGYFYLQGLRTFAVEFLRGRFGLGQVTASTLVVLIGIGAVVGALVTGRIADRLVKGGHLAARVWVAGTAFLVAVAMLIPGLLVPSLVAGLALMFVAVAGLGGTNPPLDAARLDIMHSRLWGRSESVRTALRSGLEAISPLLFGFVSSHFGGDSGGLGQPTGHVSRGATGLDITFLIMLVPVVAAGLILILARLTYPRDVATAMASEQATAA